MFYLLNVGQEHAAAHPAYFFQARFSCRVDGEALQSHADAHDLVGAFAAVVGGDNGFFMDEHLFHNIARKLHVVIQREPMREIAIDSLGQSALTGLAETGCLGGNVRIDLLDDKILLLTRGEERVNKGDKRCAEGRLPLAATWHTDEKPDFLHCSSLSDTFEGHAATNQGDCVRTIGHALCNL